MIYERLGLIHALELAKDLSNKYAGTCIAGGAARDFILKKPIKDFDIFIPISSCQIVQTVMDLNRRFPNIETTAIRYASYARPELLGVMTLPDIDIILFDANYGNTPEKIIATFDNSLSHAWFDSNGQVKTDFEFDRSVKNKRIYTYWDIPTRFSHLQRVAEKYSDFELMLVDDLKKDKSRKETVCE